MANRGNRADSAEPSGVTGAYTKANRDTRLPTVTSDIFRSAAMSGRMPTTMNSLMPSMKLDAMRITTGRLKNRSLSIRTFPLSASVRIPLFVSRYFDLFSIAYVNRLTIYFLQERINRARYNTVPMTRKMTRKTNRSGNSGGKTGGNRSRNRKTSNRKTGNRKSLVPKNLRRKLRNTWNKASLKQRIGMIATTLVATVAAIAIIAGLIRFVGWRVQVSEAKAAQSEMRSLYDFNPGNIISDGAFFNGNALSERQVQTILDQQGIEHPHIVTESGRATVAYYSILLFNILDVSIAETGESIPDVLPEDVPEPVVNLREVLQGLSVRNLQECYNDAVYYRDEMRQLFITGRVTLRQRTLADKYFWAIINRIAEEKEKLKHTPKELADIDSTLADIYYGNFSVFQSLPDAWAIDQLFPVMPVHRLTEFPSRKAVISDITCDSDGRIDKFIDPQGMRTSLDLHPLVDGDEYYLGVFLVGAYQETLGDLHNLLGDTNVVSIRISEDGSYQFVREIRGDSVADILDYVEYDPRRILEDLREAAERAVREKRITPSERYKILQTFEDGLRGYTYFER